VLFHGPSSGLGNRLEKILLLLVHSRRTGERIHFVWSNPPRHQWASRTYEPMLHVEGMIVSKRTPRSGYVPWGNRSMPNFRDVTAAELFAAGRAVTPTFAVEWGEEGKHAPPPDVCLHIRGGDKLKSTSKDIINASHLGINNGGITGPVTKTWTSLQAADLLRRAVAYVTE
jgi:hypothetical protein